MLFRVAAVAQVRQAGFNRVQHFGPRGLAAPPEPIDGIGFVKANENAAGTVVKQVEPVVYLALDRLLFDRPQRGNAGVPHDRNPGQVRKPRSSPRAC